MTKEITALIVDDDFSTQDLLGSILRALGYHKTWGAANGDDAVHKMKHNPLIVFLDIEMKGKDGFATLKEILELKPDQYVVMVSAHSTLDNVKKAIACGARGFIVKPYNMGKIKEAVDGCLADAASRSKSKPSPDHAGDASSSPPDDAQT